MNDTEEERTHNEDFNEEFNDQSKRHKDKNQNHQSNLIFDDFDISNKPKSSFEWQINYGFD
jgi:hypothetical protein